MQGYVLLGARAKGKRTYGSHAIKCEGKRKKKGDGSYNSFLSEKNSSGDSLPSAFLFLPPLQR
jgi:hypothetical protein